MGNYSKHPDGAGIYKLTCIPNGKIYIGKTVDFRRRFTEHKYCEKKIKGRCYFQYVIKKYGWDAFDIEILEIFKNFNRNKDNQALIDKETYYIELFNSTDRNIGYNLCNSSNDRTGILHSEESKEKMSKAKLGKTCSEETKEKMKQSKLGCSLSIKHKESISQGNIGKICSDEKRKALRVSNLGQSRSEETKEKMRQARLGKKLDKQSRKYN